MRTKAFQLVTCSQRRLTRTAWWRKVELIPWVKKVQVFLSAKAVTHEKSNVEILTKNPPMAAKLEDYIDAKKLLLVC